MSDRDLAVDGLAPGAVERPGDEAEVARLLHEAAAAGRAVVPVGGGRLLGFGSRLERVDTALDMRGLDRVLEQSAADLTVSVQAGITLDALNEALGAAGQFLPLDPPGGPGHTIGGLLATGLSGPLRRRYGSARDFLIGLRVALPDGRLVTSGGRVVKNVSGYDMNKLHLGALGSLGVIVAATFKVFPLPHHEVTLGVEGGLEMARRAEALPLPPVALEILGEGRVLARFGGTEAAVTLVARELGWPAADGSEWARLAQRTSDRWARISVVPGELAGILELLPAPGTWQASAHGVVQWYDYDPAALPAVRRAAEASGGSLVLVNAPVADKEALDAWGERPATLDVMRRLRDAFDPARTISPGRYLV